MNFIKKVLSSANNIVNDDSNVNNIIKINNVKIKNYELDNAFFLHTDKNTPLCDIISDNILTIKVVNVIEKNKIRGIINVNYNFLKFNIILLNKKFVNINDLYFSLTNSNDIDNMLNHFNNNNIFINAKIKNIDINNNLLCEII